MPRNIWCIEEVGPVTQLMKHLAGGQPEEEDHSFPQTMAFGALEWFTEIVHSPSSGSLRLDHLLPSEGKTRAPLSLPSQESKAIVGDLG